jgi:hypothetical protein
MLETVRPKNAFRRTVRVRFQEQTRAGPACSVGRPDGGDLPVSQNMRSCLPSGVRQRMTGMTGSNRRTVAPHNGRWAVEKPGTSRVNSIHDTQREAQDVARAALGRTGGGELVTLGTNGQIRSKDTIAPGHDPFPPRG